ncbi:hypothetical protein LTS18_014127, partial [Coniosporium uncinatum]
MGSQKLKLGPKAHLPFKVGNKQRRQALGLKRKKALDSLRRDERFKRRREEDKNPRLRENRLAHNIPATLDRKRVWDDVAGDEEDALGLAVDVERLKRRKTDEEEAAKADVEENEQEDGKDSEEEDDDADSMLDENEGNEDEEADDIEVDRPMKRRKDEAQRQRSTSPPASTASTRLDLTPEALMVKFPTLFEPPKEPK